MLCSRGERRGMALTKAVILARGLGTRMRRAAAGVGLDDAQARAADSGVKGLIPVGRPFLDFVISALADAGYRDVCLVVAPEPGALRDYYGGEAAPTRVRLAFAVQRDPLGTADAVASAEEFAAGEEFLLINSDNYYPISVLQAVAALPGPGLAGFDRASLVEGGNIDDDRIRSYAVLDVGPDGTLVDIVEKPDAERWSRTPSRALISMNCWRFGPSIFAAARAVGLSPRGEYELADAVRIAIRRGERFRVAPVQSGVLDLSQRADIPGVASRLAGVQVRL
jgi:dTDP-glucose pyrophosphorylase